jgi:hypothetical protein
MTTETRNTFKSLLDDLKQAISQSMGEHNECTNVIEQIESTLGRIEQKVSIANPVETTTAV